MNDFDRAQMARKFAEILVASSQYDYMPLSDATAVIARHSFGLADAMIAEENKRKTTKND